MYDTNVWYNLVGDDDTEINVGSTRIHGYASFSVLEELAKNQECEPKLYRRLIDKYFDATLGRLILPCSELVRLELNRGRPLTLEECLVSKECYYEVFNMALEDGLVAEYVSGRVRTTKEDYETSLSTTFDDLKSELQEQTPETRDIVKNWFNSFKDHIQECGEQAFGNTCIDYLRLPHVSTSLAYLAASHYLRATKGKNHRGNDLYDHRIYVESVTLGYLVTEDKSLRRTAELVSKTGVSDQPIEVYGRAEFNNVIAERCQLSDSPRRDAGIPGK